MKFAQILFLSSLMYTASFAYAQLDYSLDAAPSLPAKPDPKIAGALKKIQAASIRQEITLLANFGTRSTLSSGDKELPSGQGIDAAADWIEAQFQQISKATCEGCIKIHRDTFIEQPMSRIPKPTTITNIYAVMPGNDPEQAKRIYLVMGHYDSRTTDVMDAHGAAPGANDDASGTAVVLECARALAEMRFPATVVFAIVAGEEQGLNGSKHLAKLAHDEGWQIEAVLNNDIVGGNTTPGDMLQRKDRVRIFSEGLPTSATPEQAKRIRATGGEDDSPSRGLARTIADVDRSYFPAVSGSQFLAHLVFRPDRYLRGSDHLSFNQEGYAAVRFTEWREDFHHQHQIVKYPAKGSNEPVMGDLPEFVDFDYVSNVARLNAATLATLASSPGIPAKLTIETKQLENSTTLRWVAPAGAGAAVCYEVLWRETTAADWQYAGKPICPARQAESAPITTTVPVSKDNVIFGVRAFDGAGHRGLVAVP